MSAPETGGDVRIVEAPYGSELYRQALVLREAILRAPLGLAVTPEEQADDARRRHFCALSGGIVVGSVSFEPLDGETVQLRQMAVAAGRRLAGIGARLLTCGEAWARDNGYRLVVLHARLGADGFYARFGYRAQGKPFDEHTVPHILMTKPLVPRRESAHRFGEHGPRHDIDRAAPEPGQAPCSVEQSLHHRHPRHCEMLMTLGVPGLPLFAVLPGVPC